MKIRIIKILLFFTIIFCPENFAVFKFSHRNATVSIGNARFVINNALTNWNGTLEQKGSVVGQTISFNEGILNRNGTPAFATCTYDGDATRQITLSTNQLLRVDHGQFLPKLDIIRSGNRLEGAPIFTNTQSINLAHHLSSLTIAVNGKLNSDIVMNRGSIILDDDLHLGDDRNFTGSGQIFFNNKRLSFGGSNMTLTHTIDFINASDIILNSYLSLSGIWTFSGSEAHVVGNGNILDLSSGGTIWVKAGTKLFLTDIKIKGLGSGYFVFEDDASQIRLSDAQIEMASNYTITQGGIYVDGDTTIVTKDNILTFDQFGTLTVDGVTLWYDTTIYPNAFNIQTGEYSQDPTGANIATINDGRIAAVTTDDCCRANSNAIVSLSDCCINNSQRITNNSNAIISLKECCVNNSQRITNNSNAIVSLSDCCINNSQRITNNSNAIISLKECCVNNSQRITNNSNAIVSLSDCCINNSQRITNNSNAIISLKECCVNNSQRITNNSNAIVSLSDCCINNSQRITNNSNAIISLKECCENNSNAIINIDNRLTTISNFLATITLNTNFLSLLVVQNSQAIILLDECCRNNSNAIVVHDKEITNNSNAIITLEECCRNNSNAIVVHDKEIVNNSNAIIALEECCRHNSNAIVVHDKEIVNNSNAIVSLKDCCINNSQRITNNSNAIIVLEECCRHNSNAIVVHDKEIVNNSNAIVSLKDCCENNSNAIVSLAECCENNSNAIVSIQQQVINNSNAIVSINIGNTELVIQNSNAIVSLTNCCRNNSNAIIRIAQCCANSNVIGDCCPLTKAPLTTDVSMTCNCIVHPVQQIRISADLTIDGQGAWIMFSNPETPEFIIDPGVTVRLKDVSLLRLTNRTFQFGAGSKLEIEGVVVFELIEDLFFTNENVEIIGTTDSPSILFVRGMGSQRNIFFEPIISGGSILKTWNLNFNSLVLQNIELLGVESIQATEVPLIGGDILAGQITLAGQAAVDIAIDTDISFGIEDLDNRLVLLDNELVLNKFILYSPFLDSELHIKFQLPTLIVGNPLVNFADDLLFLTGVEGQARLIFDDYWAQVFNLGSNSFGTDIRAFIGGRNVEIANFPIKQSASDLILDSTLLMHATAPLPNAIETAFIKSPERIRPSGKRVTTAFNMMRKKLQVHTKQKAEQDLARLEQAKKQKPKVNSIVIGKPKYGKKRRGFEIVEDIDDVTRAQLLSLAPKLPLRAVTLPTDGEVTLKITGPAVDANQLAGTVIVSDGSVTNFGVSATGDLNLFMLGDATLVQGEPEPTKIAMRLTRALEEKDFKEENINFVIDGDNNKYVIKQDTIVKGPMALNDNTRYTTQFDSKNFEPEILFRFTLSNGVPAGARFEFTGKGTTWFDQDYSFELKEASDTGSGQRTTLAFSDGVKTKFKRKLITDLTTSELRAVSDEFDAGKKVTINGTGALKIDTGAQVLVEKNQHLVIGGDDGDIAISVDRFGVFSVDSSAQTIDALVTKVCEESASVSMFSATYSIDVNEGAILNIGCDACFGINWDSQTEDKNMDLGVEGRGTLTNFKIKNRGVLNIEKGGRLIVGRNLDPDATGLTGFGSKFLFDPFGGIITGQGIVALGKSGFAGRIQSNNARPAYVVAQQFVRALINIVPSLKFATVFIDENGTKKLFNSGIFDDGMGTVTLVNNTGNKALIDPGVERQFIKLQPGDEVCGDDPTTGIVFGYNNGVRFTILPNGKRLNS